MSTEKLLRKEEPKAIERFDPLGWFNEMDRFFPRTWLRGWPGEHLGFGELFPRADIIDLEDKVIVRAMVPGYRKEDIEVSLTDDTVTIRGKTEHREEVKKGEYYRAEMYHGDFVRTLGLPATVDDAKAEALYKDGVLELVLPKIEKVRRHKVEIH